MGPSHQAGAAPSHITEHHTPFKSSTVDLICRPTRDQYQVSTTATRLLGKGGASPTFRTSYKMSLRNLNRGLAANGESRCMPLPAGSFCSVLAPGNCILDGGRIMKHKSTLVQRRVAFAKDGKPIDPR
ncbi:hypothetical protein V8C26DRAFT_399343 [Trichoderma gracile]